MNYTDTRVAGRIAAAMFVLAGALVLATAPVVPWSPGVDPEGLISLAFVAVGAGAALWVLPWQRWRPSTTLWIAPPALAMIGLFNHLTNATGFTYSIFFTLAFGWVGLAHPRWTGIKLIPLASAAYLIPLLVNDAPGVGIWSLLYVAPVLAMTSESMAWIGDRLRRSESSLESQRLGFGALFTDNPQPMWVYDTTSLRFLEVNDAAIAHYGYSREEFLARTIVDIRPDDEVARFLEFLRTRPPGPTYFSEWRNVKADGEEINVEITSHDLVLNGRSVALVSVRDVTERHHAADALRRSEKRARGILAAANDAFIGMDSKGRIIEWNERAEATFGWSAAEAIGRSVADTIVPERMRESHSAGLARVLQTSESNIVNQRVEVIAIDRLEREFPVELAVWAVDVGTPEVSFRAFVHDISDRKRDEDELRLSGSKLEGAQRLANLGSFEWDMRSDLVTWSEEMFRICGVVPETFDATLEGFIALVHPDDRAEVRTSIESAIADCGHFEFEHRLVRPNGQLRVLSSHGEVHADDNGAPIRLLGVSQDVTERRAQEDALRRSEHEVRIARDEALEASRLKSQFLANTSHEIRTPMNGVLGMIGLLLDTELNDEQRDYAETMARSTEDLMVTINDILDFSKIEAGKIELEDREFEMHTVIDRAIESLAVRAFGKQLELTCYIDPKIPAVVRGDEIRLRQILGNLVSNAVKFTETGTVEVEAFAEQSLGRDVVVRFSVRDTGIGIEMADPSTLFESFRQADGSTTRRYGGSGLGLAICHQLVELMGGEIGFAARPEGGSEFWFTIPFVGATRGAAPPPALLAASARVLVASANPTVRSSVARLLTTWGCRVDTASDGIGALDALAVGADLGDPFALAILDCSIDDSDQLELATRIATSPELRNTRRIALCSPTGGGSPETDAVDGWLKKPVREGALVESLNRLQEDAPTMSANTTHAAPAVITASGNRRLLLVEDNAINQKVAVAYLDQLGYTTDVAQDGIEALEVLERHQYAAILMDCRMPRMDGYDTTQEIR
ncbi:MAG TPA: PAS domain S-box protein, partial [Acidimicrobiales bacterium]|nr:PAS domain S-box protein [Acidimicrobiales bacterium]